MLKQIYVNISFPGIHRWKDAPSEVGFLKDWHRHLFNVKVYFEINHNDRDLEFFMMKQKVETAIRNLYDEKYGVFAVGSCEMIAQDLLEYFNEPITKIEVNEDGENGIEFIS